MKINSYKDLIVWQKSMDLCEDIYLVISKLPKDENFALSSQIRRSVTSIPSNIAEGYGRNNRKEYIQFLGIASGSAAELETQILIIQRLYKDIKVETTLGLLNEIQKMLSVLIKKLKSPQP